MLRTFLDAAYRGLHGTEKHVHTVGHHFHTHRKKYFAANAAFAVLFVALSITGISSNPDKVSASGPITVTWVTPSGNPDPSGSPPLYQQVSENSDNETIPSAILINFSEAMDGDTITSDSFRVTKGSPNPIPVEGAITCGNMGVYGSCIGTDAVQARFIPTSPFEYASYYNVALDAEGKVSPILGAFGAALQPNIGPMIYEHRFSFSTLQDPAVGPNVTLVSPLNAATGVAVNSTITVTFDKSIMNTSTINESNFQVLAGAVPVAGTAAWNGPGSGTSTATFTPSSNLSPNTTYYVSLNTSIQDAEVGGFLGSVFSWSFVTAPADVTAPQVFTQYYIAPALNAGSVSTSPTIGIAFTEELDTDSLSGNMTVTHAGGSITGAPRWGAFNTLYFENNLMPVTLAQSTTYTVTVKGAVNGVDGGLKDIAGNSLANDYSWQFHTTEAFPDIVGPTISSRSPAQNAVDVAINSPVTITFNEAIDPTTITLTTVSVAPTLGGSAVVSSVSLSENGLTATFLAPVITPYSAGTSYTVTLTSGIEDVAGNPFTGTTWVFTTVSEEENESLTVSTVSPVSGFGAAALDANVVITLSAAPDQNTVNSNTFYIQSAGGVVAGTYSFDGTSMTFNPNANLTGGTLYDVRVISGLNGVKDAEGNTLADTFMSSFTTVASGGNEDPVDNSGPPVAFARRAVTGVDSANGTVYFASKDPATGTTYIGGSFSTVGGQSRNGLAAIDEDGNVTSWNPGLNSGAIVYAAASAEDGFYIGGDFTYGDPVVTHTKLAYVHSADNDVEAWDPGIPDEPVRAMARSSNALWIGGDFTTIGVNTCTRLASISTINGEVNCADSFGADNSVKAMVISQDGNTLFAGGAFTEIGVVGREKIAMFDIEGQPTLAGWNQEPGGTVNTIYLDSTTLYIGGAFTTVGETTRNHIVAFDFSGEMGGAIDANWNPDIDGTVESIYVANSEVYVGGSFSAVNGNLIRTNAASFDKADGENLGTAEPWNPTLSNTVYAVLADDEMIDLGGDFITQSYFTRYVPATAGVTLSNTTVSLAEGSIVDNYQIVLDMAPSNDVVITVAPDAQATVDPTSVTFTSSNWYTPQTITITPVNDSTVEGEHTTTIINSAASDDVSYSGISITNVAGTIVDNDVAEEEVAEEEAQPVVVQSPGGAVIMIGINNPSDKGAKSRQFEKGKVKKSVALSSNDQSKLILTENTTLWAHQGTLNGESFAGTVMAPRVLDPTKIDTTSLPKNADKILAGVEMLTNEQITLTRLAKLEMELPAEATKMYKTKLYYIDKDTGEWEVVPLGRVSRSKNTFDSMIRKLGGTYVLVQEK